MWAQKKGTQYRFPWNLAGSPSDPEDLSPWYGNGNWEEGATEEKVFQSFCRYPLTRHTPCLCRPTASDLL